MTLKTEPLFNRHALLSRVVSAGASMVLLLSAIAYGQQPTVQARAVQPVAVSGDLIDPMKAIDGRQETRATSGSGNYVGKSVTLDLGGTQNIIGTWQDHGRWPTFYAGGYRVEVGLSADGPWMKTFEGAGNRGDSKALFEAVRGRFIRITATATGGGADEWSVAELKAMIDPGAMPRVIDQPGRPGERPGPAADAKTQGDLKDLSLALDRNPETRATSNTPNYRGMAFTFDLGGEYQLSRVVQAHGKWPEDFPAEYKIEVSRRRDEASFREVWRGRGELNRSVAEFDPVNTRYIRVTALQNRDRVHWWSIAELRTNRDPDLIERDEDDSRLVRNIRSATAQGLSDIVAAVDEREGTRATTGKADYAGSWVQLDLGGSYTVSKVVQAHEPDDRDYPGRYKIEVSQDGSRWQMVWEGEGKPGRSTASFSQVRARYIRITATANRNNQNWWSIHSLRVRG